VDRLQQVARDERDAHVELELALQAADGDGGVVADDLRGHLEDNLGITGLTLPGMIDEPFCSSGRKISPMPARGPEPMRAMSCAILVSDTATTFSAPDSSTSASRLACASNGSAGGSIFSLVWRVSSRRTFSANFGCVLSPVPVAVPPSGIWRTWTSAASMRSCPRRTCAA
jgi:hypothetical protein